MTKPCLPIQISRPKDFIQSKSASSIVGCGNELPYFGRSLKTPIRRFFFRFEALKSSASGTGNKRSRVDERGNDVEFTLEPLAHTPPLSSDVATSPMTELDTPDVGPHTYSVPSPGQQCTFPVPCMALQNSDQSVDAVVISTLLKLPFCCHEDLLTMSPTRVVEVAQEMNERLPEVFKINLNEPYDHNGIRREVERLVGIVKSMNGVAVPGAPLKRSKSKGRRELGEVEFLGHSDFGTISPPTSPLANISKTRGRRRLGQGNFKPVPSPPKLTMLQEEEEEEEAGKHGLRMAFPGDTRTNVEEDIFRAAKKRRTLVSSAEIAPNMRRSKTPLMLTKPCDDINDASHTPPCIRDRTMREIWLNDDTSAAAAVQSGKVIVKTTVIDRSLVNTRPRYRSSSKFAHAQPALKSDLFDGPLRTSTPKLAQMERQSRVLGMKVVSPVQKARCRKQRNFKDVSPDWSLEVSRIPRYRRVNRSAHGRMDCMLVGVNSLLESDGNKTI